MYDDNGNLHFVKDAEWEIDLLPIFYAASRGRAGQTSILVMEHRRTKSNDSSATYP
jgi:hypothetical protein